MSFRVKLKIEKNRADLEYIRSKICCKISDLTGKIEKRLQMQYSLQYRRYYL